MSIGTVIRKYRKEKQLTQEEMAGYLGVTAPAVNKWENENSLPDISLLSPIARLLGISTDILLSYREELTEKEIDEIILAVSNRIKSGEEYGAVFSWAEKKIQEYPNCDRLIFQIAQVLDGYRYIYGNTEAEEYREKIYGLYVRSLQSADGDVAQSAAAALFHMAVAEEDYEKAQEYLDRIPKRGFNQNQMQAILYHRQKKVQEAYQLYERILFIGFNDLNGALNGLLSLSMEEGKIDKARSIVDKQKKMAEILEMGKYMEVFPGLDLAIHLRDKEEILRILEGVVCSIKDMDAFKNSELYSHMTFSSAGIREIALMLKNAIENDKEMEFVKTDRRYQELLEKLCRFIEN